MNKIRINNPLVSAEWLKENKEAKNIVILDATIPKVTSRKNNSNSLSNDQIKNARFIDIKNKFSDLSINLPNTMMSAVDFTRAAQGIGIDKDSAIVVYDEYGIYSSSRVWWMFKSMGHDNIAVLDGGFPEWQKAGYTIEEKKIFSGDRGDFEAYYIPEYFKNTNDIIERINDRQSLVIDARAEERFKGLVAEPRKGLRSGHIPASVNFPYTKLISENKMLSKENISREFKEIVNNDIPLIFSCGSGITACTLALGAEIIGLKNLSVYDGSWTEWGSNLDFS